MGIGLTGCGQITLAPDDMPVVVDDMAAFRGDMAGNDGPVGPIAPAIRVSADFVGFPTKLDATASTDAQSRSLSYLWHFTSVPAGSHAGDSCAPSGGFSTCLSDPTDAMPSFEPDVGGSYGISLTVTAGSDTATLPMSFIVPTDTVFVSLGHSSTATDTAIASVRTDGTGLKDVSCRKHGDGGIFDDNTPGFNLTFSWLYGGLFGLSSVAGAGGGRSFSYLDIDFLDGGINGSLFAGSDTSDCTSNPVVRIDDPAGPAGYLRLYPRFSPDGKRVVYLEAPSDLSSGASRIVTVGADGTGVHVISTALTVDVIVRPIWLDNSTVAWVQNAGSDSAPQLGIYKHADVTGGPFSGDAAFIDCTASALTTLEQIDVLSLAPLAMLVVGSTDPFTEQNSPSTQTLDLYRVTNPASGSCHLDNLTKNPTHIWARDFVLTPDGKTAYYASTNGQDVDSGRGDGLLSDIWSVPVDGSAAAQYFAGAPKLNDIGPHFVANGRQLVWTQTSISGGELREDAGLNGGGAMIANLDGTHRRSLVSESGHLSNGTGVLGGMNLGAVQCSVAGDQLGDALRALGGGAAAALLLAMLAVARRRRRIS